MEELKASLASQKSKTTRTKISLIGELFEDIVKAQRRGYSLKEIHAEIKQHIEITIDSFKSTLFRVRHAKDEKAVTKAEEKKVSSPSLNESEAVESDPEPEPEAVEKPLSRTERSKLILNKHKQANR